MKQLFQFIYLWLWNIVWPMRLILDASDNSATVNRSLYKALLFLGIEQNNRIHTVAAYPGRFSRCSHYMYYFLLWPKDSSEVDNPYYSHLTHNKIEGCLGWEMLSPSVNQIFYNYRVPYTIHTYTARISPRLNMGTEQSNLLFKINKP